MALVFAYAAFEGAVTTDSGSPFHVSTILLLKLLLQISLRSSSLRLCLLLGLSLEDVNLINLYLLPHFVYSIYNFIDLYHMFFEKVILWAQN